MGDIGNLSNLLVRDLMTVGVPTCGLETPITDIARLFLEKELDAVIVLDGDEGHALGYVDQDALVEALSNEAYPSLQVADIMKEGVPQVPPDIPLSAAAQIMRDWRVRTLFLMHHAGGIEYPAAMISYKHLLRYIGAKQHEDLRDLGIYAERSSPLASFIQKRDAARKQNVINYE